MPDPYYGSPVFLVNADGTPWTGGAGDASAANQTAELVLIGAVNETAPATDTANSGLNGREQRIAQNLTTLTASVNGQNTSPSTPAYVTQVPVAAGGLTKSSVILGASTNATSVKASPGQVYEIECFNNSGSVAYLKLFDKASAPTVGSDTPVWRVLIPANTLGAGIRINIVQGVPFATGIAYAVTGGILDADTAAVAASAFIVNLGYK